VAAAADTEDVERLVVECLRCGQPRAIVPGPRRYQGAGECPRCRYVGWAESAELNERTRGLCRTVPPERRVRLRIA
jgi:hypothetical protein